MELRRESASNLLEKLLSAKLRLLNCIRDPAPGFILASGEGDVEIVEEGQRANKVKAAITALPSEILYSELDIDLPEELKTLVTDASYWKGVTALESLLKTICSCLTYLEGDKATFSSVYACFVAIKLHIVTLLTSVRSALYLDDTAIEKMISLLHHRLATIYSEAHCFAFATDPLFGSMRAAITAKYDGAFLELGKGSINQQFKAALSRIVADNDELRRQLYTEYGKYVMRPLNADHDFEEVLFKPSELWSLCDDSSYGSLKGPLSAVHCNPAGAAGGERNHKAAKRVHCRTRSRMGTNKVETGIAILFNAKQLDRRLPSTRDTPFCHWLHRLAEPGEDDDAAEGETGSGEDDEIGNDDDIMWEFDRIDLQLGIGSIDDALLFEEEVVLEEGNVVFD
ncbi:unnamed protein product [Sphagnum troendelagicum]|uniref:Uncharacterized protein n=1 Tax=Sphagnum troendelagicum TaxID=128251 RepID=A0ABP0V4E9_9BRYO